MFKKLLKIGEEVVHVFTPYNISPIISFRRVFKKIKNKNTHAFFIFIFNYLTRTDIIENICKKPTLESPIIIKLFAFFFSKGSSKRSFEKRRRNKKKKKLD